LNASSLYIRYWLEISLEPTVDLLLGKSLKLLGVRELSENKEEGGL